LNLSRLNKLRKILNKFLLFVFFIFTVSDLIEMHLKVIYKIDLYAHFPISKTGCSQKVKGGKVKTKDFHSSPDLSFYLTKSTRIKTFACKINASLKHIILPHESSKLKSSGTRAPPSC